MPDIAEPPVQPKKSFTQTMSEGRPANKEQLEAAATKPAEAAPVKLDEPAKLVEVAKSVDPRVMNLTADPDAEILSGKRKPVNADFDRVKNAADSANKARDEFKAKTESYEKELGELRKAPKHNADIIKQLEAERDKYKGMFEEVAVELSPEFHAGYDAKLNAIKAGLPAEAADQLMTLLQMPDSKSKRERVLELLDGADQFTLAQVARADEKIQEVIADKRSKLAKANETLGKIGAERKAKMEAQAQEYSKSFTDELAKKQDAKEGIVFFQRREEKAPEDKAWNQGVSEREQVAKAIYENNLSPSERAEAALAAASVPFMISNFTTQIQKKDSRIAELEATVAKMTASNPNLGGGGGGLPAGGEKRGNLAGKWLKEMPM